MNEDLDEDDLYAFLTRRNVNIEIMKKEKVCQYVKIFM